MADWSFRNILPNLQQAASNVGQAAMNVPGNFVQKVQDAARFGPQNLANAWQGAKNVWSQPVGDVLSNAGSNALTGLGLAMNAPKQAVYQEGNQFANALGSTAPDVKNFKDILVNQGMNPESYLTKGLGLAGDIATDPMTYALAGPTKQAMTSMFGGARGLATNPGMRESLKDVAVFKGMSPHTVGEIPQAMTHSAAMPGGQTWVGRVARGQQAAEDWATRTLGEFNLDAAAAADQQLGTKFGRVASAYARAPGMQAVYLPQTQAIGTMGAEATAAMGVPTAPGTMLRHELTHALINQAAQSGETQGLPMAMRIPAALRRSALLANSGEGSVRTGLATVADELAAHALENRGLLGQLQGAGGFLFGKGNPIYTNIFAGEGMNPAVLRAYSALPGAARLTGQAAKAGAAGAGVGAAGAGTSALLDKLQGQQATYPLYGLR